METNNEINIKKYNHYKHMLANLNLSLDKGFYLQAVLIEYAMIEDRISSIIRHLISEDAIFNKDGNVLMMNRKIKLIKEYVPKIKDAWLKKYLENELLDNVIEWKNRRNKIVHALMNRFDEDDLIRDVAVEGKDLSRKINDLATKIKSRLKVLNKKK